MGNNNKTKTQLMDEPAVPHRRVEELETLRAENNLLKETLCKAEHDLRDRTKHLSCIYGIADVVEQPIITLEEVLQGIVNLLPPAWQYPEITCGRIRIKGKQEYRTLNFKETPFQQTSDIRVKGNHIGTVEVLYLEERQGCDEGPFLKEERSLIDAIAERLGRIIERNAIEEAVREGEDKYRELVENANSIILRMDTMGTVTFFNDFSQHFFGYTREEILGRNVVGTIVPEYESTGRDLKWLIEDIGRNPELYVNNVNENTRHNGERVWIAWTNKPVYDERGRVAEILCIGNDITARKHDEDILQEYEKAVEGSQDMIVSVDCDYRYRLANAAFLKCRGMSKEQVIGRSVSEILGKDVFEQIVKENIDRCFRGEVVHHEMILTYPDLGERELLVSHLPISGPNGIDRVTTVIRDMTEQRHMEAALKRSEEKYRSLFENAVEGVFQTTTDGRYISVNPALATMYGYDSPDEMIDSITDIERQQYVNPEDRETLKNLYDRHGFVEGFETQLYRKDGGKVWISMNARAVRGGDGEIMYYEGTTEDITTRKQAEGALRDSEGTLRALINATQETLLLIDRSGTVLVANEVIAQRLGKTCQDLVGTCLYDHYPPDVAAFRKAAFDKVAVTGESVHFTDSRKGRFYEVYAYPVFAGDGTVARVAIFAHDITERTQAQEEKTRLESQLRQSQKIEAIGTLAGGIAHDFNNILAGIIGFTEMVQGGMAPDSREYHRLGLVLKGANRGRDLVKQILTLSRQAEYEQKPVALSGIVEEGLKLLRPILPATIEIQSKSLTDDDTILADPAQMHQVLMNLCTNGAHAMGRKGGLLEISVTKNHFRKGDHTPAPDVRKPGDYVTLAVRDTGCGMKPEVLERVFDPFFTTKARGKGTGLGLSVVHGIVKSHGGFIKVESEPGKGSVFYVYLPKTERQEGLTVNEEHPVRGGRECILFVDDEDLTVELNNEMLTQLGYEVVATTSSLEALEIFKKEPRRFHLVITDYTMPHMTGVDLARKLLKVRNDIPIILCTGYNDDISSDKAKKVGIREFLMKPKSKRELDLAIRRVLK